MNQTRVVGALLAVIALVGTLTACSTRAPADFVILYYKAGAGDNREFQECIEPGHAGSYPVDDEVFPLPVSLRTWNIAVQGGDTDRPITSGSKPAPVNGPDGRPTGQTQPGPEVLIWATADFYINTDCAGGKDSPVVKFWEQTGRRSWKDGHGIAVDGENPDSFQEDAWRVMLENTLVPAEQVAIRGETRKWSADDLDANANGVWRIMEQQIAPEFNRALRDKVGGDYFCGPQYVRGQEVEWSEFVPDGVDAAGLPRFREEKRRGKCPPVRITITDVAFANAEIARARADVFAAEQRAKAALIDAQSRAEVARQLEQVGNSPAYVELERVKAELERVKAQVIAAEACKTNPNCTVIIGDASVNRSIGR